MNRSSALVGSLWLLLALGCGGSDDLKTTADAATADGATADAATADAAVIATESFPCEVEAVLKAKCWTCHTNPPKGGAPVPLLTWADTQKPATTAANRKIWEMMQELVTGGGMPFPGSPTGPLEPDQKKTLLDWLAAGAKPSATACK